MHALSASRKTLIIRFTENAEALLQPAFVAVRIILAQNATTLTIQIRLYRQSEYVWRYDMEIVLLGSTGSIGTQTLDVCRMHNIRVKALSANCNVELLEKQAREFLPEYIAVSDEKYYSDIKTRLSDTNVKVLCGEQSVCELAVMKCERVVNSVV